MKINIILANLVFAVLNFIYALKLKSIMFLELNNVVVFTSIFSTNFIVLFVFNKIKYLDKFFITLFFGLISVIYFLSLFVFGFKMDRAIVAAALDNETEMIWFYYTPLNIFIGCVWSSFVFFASRKLDKKITKQSIIAFCMSLLFIAGVFFSGTKYKRSMLISPVLDVFDFINIKKSFVENHYKLQSGFSIQDENINVVIVIGESTRHDFFKEYAVKIQNEGIILSKSQSQTTFTRNEVPRILSLGGRKEDSIVDIFKSMGFKTHWIGSQSIRGANDTTYAYYTLNSDVKIYKDTVRFIKNDFELLHYIDNNLHKSGKNLYIIHQIGSHIPFSKRFDEAHAKYTPYCEGEEMKSCSRIEQENAYKNSILYQDDFFVEVLKRFKDKKTFMFYTSDHGLDLIKIDNEAGTNVPVFMWSNVVDLKQAKQNFKKLTFIHEKASESILGCVGVKSKNINQENNVCSKNYR